MDSMSINREWATRPADERFVDVRTLHDFNVSKRARSLVEDTAVEHLRIRPSTSKGMVLVNPNGDQGRLNHWSFSQLCQRAHAPAGYLRTLPEPLAAVPLQWSLENVKDDRDAKLLVRRPESLDQMSTVSAITSPSYGRIYDAEVSEAILNHIDLSKWKVPSASYAAKDPKKATTLYASDRDMFIALVDDSRPVEVPGNNGIDTLFRGFIVRNSEVGSAAFEMFMFLYRTICDNRIIWGMSDAQHLRIRHTIGGPSRFIAEAKPVLTEYINSSTRKEVDAIQTAHQTRRLGETKKDVTSWLRKHGFSISESNSISDISETLPGDARSVWNVVQAGTELAHGINYGDDRLSFERQVAKIMEVAA